MLQLSPMQLGLSFGFGRSLILMANLYSLQPTQIPKAVSRYKSSKHIKQRKHVGSNNAGFVCK